MTLKKAWTQRCNKSWGTRGPCQKVLICLYSNKKLTLDKCIAFEVYLNIEYAKTNLDESGGWFA